MSISRQDVEYVARLARLELSEDELERFTEQLAQILEHAARVQALDTEDIEPTAHPMQLANVLRSDVPSSVPIDRDLVLENAPATEDGYFRVPRILDTSQSRPESDTR